MPALRLDRVEAGDPVHRLRAPGPGIFEYTMRRNDGSSSVFQEALPVRWRLGERLIFIDGASPRIAPATGASLAD